MATPPPPPRLAGEPQRDNVAIVDWAWSFYRAVVLEQAYADQTTVSALQQTVDGVADPASGTVATAQDTANNALIAATNALAQLAAMDAGEVTISDAATSAAVTFSTDQADTSYYITASAKSVTGTPAAGAYTVAGISGEATTGFTLHVTAAPGAGKSVTFAWHLQR